MERAKLEEYLGKVYYLERSLYEQNSSLNRLYQRLNEMEREKNKPIRKNRLMMQMVIMLRQQWHMVLWEELVV